MVFLLQDYKICVWLFALRPSILGLFAAEPKEDKLLIFSIFKGFLDLAEAMLHYEIGFARKKFMTES